MSKDIAIEDLRKSLEKIKGQDRGAAIRPTRSAGRRPAGEKKEERPSPVRVGVVLPAVDSGDPMEALAAVMWHTDPRKILWSGIAAEETGGHYAGFFPQLSLCCPRILEGAGNFLENVRDLAASSDVIVIAGLFSPASCRKLLTVDWQGKPVVLRSDEDSSGARRMFSQLLPCASHFTAVSEAAAGAFHRWFKNRAAVLYNGADPERTNPARARETMRRRWRLSGDDIAVGYYGRFTPERNPFAAAQAARRLGPPYRAVYILRDQWNDGPVVEKLRRIDPSAVIDFGQDRIGNALAGLDVVVLAADTEVHSQALIECWQAGVPVVSTPAGILPELEKRHGPMAARISPNARPAELAAAVQTALSPAAHASVAYAKELAFREFTAARAAARFAAFIGQAAAAPRTAIKLPRRPVRAAFVTHGLNLGGAERWIVSLIKHADPSRIEWTGIAVTGRTGAHAGLCRELSLYTELHGLKGRQPPRGRHFADEYFTKLHDTAEKTVDAVAKDADLFVSWGTPAKYEYVRPYGKPLVLVSHTPLRYDGLERRAVIPDIHLAAVADAGREFFVHREGADGKPIEVLWNGAETDRVRPYLGRDAQRSVWGAREDDKLIGYLGRQHEGKDYLAPARALSCLPENYRAVYHGYCIHTGNPASEALQKMMTVKPGRILAFPSEIFIGDILAGLDCIVMIGYIECFSLAMIEAWLSGTPTITGPEGVPAEFNERFGRVTFNVPYDASPEVLAHAVRRATGPEGAEAAARAKRVAFEYLTAEKMTGRWMDYFEKIAGSKPGRLSVPAPALNAAGNF